jgi:hypothetical protein
MLHRQFGNDKGQRRATKIDSIVIGEIEPISKTSWLYRHRPTFGWMKDHAGKLEANSEIMAVTVTRTLHWPARADHLEDLENHLGVAARLSRALWLALQGDAREDQRDLEALRELASAVSDHASAARYAFYKGDENRAEAQS